MDSYDLNLLRTFDALLDAGSVTDASLDLGLSVPATSRALARLRDALSDPILVRAGRGLVPTPYAQAIAPRVRALLEDADALRLRTRANDPLAWERTITIRANEGMLPVVGSILTPVIAREAPGVVLRLVSEGDESSEPLRGGGVDLDVVVRAPERSDVVVEHAVTTRFVAVTSGDPQTSGSLMDLDEFCTRPHISTSRRGRAHGPVDDALRELGRTRRVLAVFPSVASAVFMTTQGVVLPLPRLLADELLSTGMQLCWYHMPITTPDLEIGVAWHRRVDLEPPVTWVREQLVEGLRSRGDV